MKTNAIDFISDKCSACAAMFAPKRRRWFAAASALLLAISLFAAACGGSSQQSVIALPIFTDPVDKLMQTASPNFTQQLLNEAAAYEPLLVQSGTQVHMGYWSGPNNHGSLVRVLDSINAQPASARQKAIWDEGVQSSIQYPAYVTMLNEHWYDRASPVNGQVTIYGVAYTDPHPVTFAQADDIWGQYSQRYTDMAVPVQEATGNRVKAWCFVEGARANRIFYVYELPELASLEGGGAVQVFFAKTQDADWQNPDDWIEGTANAPTPLPAAQVDEGVVAEFKAAAEADPASSPRGIPWDDF
ncbi:MAG: hypothetical protein WC956_02805 [bacterium]